MSLRRLAIKTPDARFHNFFWQCREVGQELVNMQVQASRRARAGTRGQTRTAGANSRENELVVATTTRENSGMEAITIQITKASMTELGGMELAKGTTTTISLGAQELAV